MRKRTPFALAAAVLLLVGAGCAGGAPRPASAPTAQGPAMQAAPKDEIDAGVDAMVRSADDEKATGAQTESDAGEVDADKEGLDAYGNTSYDLNK